MPHMYDLPGDTVITTADYLDSASIAVWSVSCKRWNVLLSKSNQLWTRVWYRDWPLLSLIKNGHEFGTACRSNETFSMADFIERKQSELHLCNLMSQLEECKVGGMSHQPWISNYKELLAYAGTSKYNHTSHLHNISQSHENLSVRHHAAEVLWTISGSETIKAWKALLQQNPEDTLLEQGLYPIVHDVRFQGSEGRSVIDNCLEKIACRSLSS